MIALHPQLEKDCIALGEFRLCSLLLLNDASYPWFILLPNRDNLSEIFQLGEADQKQLIAESSFFSALLKNDLHADKVNVAALGNMVPQLHIHHIARFKNDPSWPAPVWGAQPAVPYTDEQRQQRITTLRPLLSATSAQPFRWYPQ